jgi:hypothetical protein
VKSDLFAEKETNVYQSIESGRYRQTKCAFNPNCALAMIRLEEGVNVKTAKHRASKKKSYSPIGTEKASPKVITILFIGYINRINPLSRRSSRK